MISLAFDTLKFANKLKASGVPEAQAEAITEAFREAQGELNLATKQDLKEVETALKRDIEALRLATKADISNLRMELREDIAELRTKLKTDITDVRTEIERMGRTIVMWMAGLAIAAVIGMTGILFALIRTMVPGA